MAYGYGDKIFTADDMAKERRGSSGVFYKTALEMLADRFEQLNKKEKIGYLTAKPKGEPIEAYISESRLVADCPVCNGAMAVNPTDQGFFCMTCENYRNFNLPLPLKIPSNLNAIEKELLKRKYPRNRNWGVSPLGGKGKGETIAELRAERMTFGGGK